jgi:hypothetical protein
MMIASQTQSQTQDPYSVRIPRITRLWFNTEKNSKEELMEMIIKKLNLFNVKEKLPKRVRTNSSYSLPNFYLEFYCQHAELMEIKIRAHRFFRYEKFSAVWK